MLTVRLLALLALVAADLVAASPIKPRSQQRAALAQIQNQIKIDTHNFLANLECVGQSCLVADTAGSTGRTPMMRAEGASSSDIQCIVKYNPAIDKLLQLYRGNPPLGPKQNTSIVSTLIGGLNVIFPVQTQPTGAYVAPCAPNILIFAKGTLEPGEYGVTAGPFITRGLPKDWVTAGVNYSPDIQGDFCLGLPGGMVAAQMINDAAKRCPDSRLFLSGFSQGSMVIRNGLAQASDYARSKVKGVVTMGDPFQGAEIKGYEGPIKVFCKPNDGICSGNFELGFGHLSYVFDDSTNKAKQAILDMAAGKGDQSCCEHRPQIPPPAPDKWAEMIKLNGGKVPVPKDGTTVEQWEDDLTSAPYGQLPKDIAPPPRASWW